MIVVMKPGATSSEIDHIIAEIERLGLKAQSIVGTERTVIAAIGEKRDGAKQALETLPGVRLKPLVSPRMAETATEIRARLTAGQDIAPLVDPRVASYIARHKLYIAT